MFTLGYDRSIGHGNEESAGTATGLFHSLETRSVLQTLQQCGLLNALDQTEVFDMLTKMPTSLMKGIACSCHS